MKHSRKGRERGSITIEASISLTAFLFAMIGLLFFIRVSRVQAAIQYSLNTAAQSISQYTYLYYAAGLYDLEQDIKESGGEAKKTVSQAADYLDQTALGVETVFSSLGGSAGNAAAAFGGGDVGGVIDVFRETGQTLQEQGANIGEQLDGLKGLAENIGDDPVSFAKSLGALVAGTGIDAVKGRLLGALYGRAMCKRYIGAGRDADEWLEHMGVEDGLDGLNFNWSSILGGDSQDVDLVVTYRMKILPGLLNLNATFAQSASTRAWLGGDARVKRDFSALASEKEETVDRTEEGKEDRTDEDAQKDEDESKPDEAPKTPPVPSSVAPRGTNLWTASGDLSAIHRREILDEYDSTEIIAGESDLYGYKAETQTFYESVGYDVLSAQFRNVDGTLKEESIKARMKTALEYTAKRAEGMSEIDTNDSNHYEVDPNQPILVEFMVLIPENSSLEDYDIVSRLLREALSETRRGMPEVYFTDGQVKIGGGEAPATSNGVTSP